MTDARAKVPQDVAHWLDRYARWCQIGLHNQPPPRAGKEKGV